MVTVQKPKRCARVLAVSIIALVGALMSGGPAGAGTLAAWVELTGRNGQASVRAVVAGGDQCPVLSGGLRMKVRAAPGGAFSDVGVCEAVVPAGTKEVRLDGKPLPLPRSDIRKVVIIGDTGCRLTYRKKQDCSTDWFFNTLARSAAAAKPDLVIHVGDYLYREPPCNAQEKHPCPTDYGWAGWNGDFFTPAQPLFAAAPWIMVRGNHEICKRAGYGWFRFLDAAPWNPTCAEMSDFRVVEAGGLGFALLDSAMLADEKDSGAATADAADDDDDDDDEEDVSEAAPPGGAADLQARWDRMGKIPPNAWVLTHVTFNAVRRVTDKKTKETTTKVDSGAQQNALGSRLVKAKVQMLVSGHIHMFEGISFANDKPPQLVVGTGGTKLAKKPDILPVINGLDVAQSKSMVDKRFGYMLWERDQKSPTKWAGTLFGLDTPDDQHVKKLARCHLDGRDLRCDKSK